MAFASRERCIHCNRVVTLFELELAGSLDICVCKYDTVMKETHISSTETYMRKIMITRVQGIILISIVKIHHA